MPATASNEPSSGPGSTTLTNSSSDNPDSGSASSSFPAAPRIKHSRPRSPAPPADPRPPAPKRARKAINCEPCRNSKLKCDRNRPCSSCVLRGTVAHCYQGQESEGTSRGEDRQGSAHVDPAAEISRIRQSVSLLESFVYQNRSPLSVAVSAPQLSHSHGKRSPSESTIPPLPRRESLDNTATPFELHGSERAAVLTTPGMLGHQSGGFYAGPTSAASHLIITTDREDEDDTHERTSSGERSPTLDRFSPGMSYDADLIEQLPPVHTIDGLVDYYFEYCNWIYRHVNQPAMQASWSRFKSGQTNDRIVLATVCILIALAIRYLPPKHALLASLPGTCEELGDRYYAVMRSALARYRNDKDYSGGRSYTLELVELLLVRSHYLTFAKEDPEETWSVRGELVSIGTAMGLHRDPGTGRFDQAVAERRRWAWWHIVLFERWQAFMFGRPLSIASHHFNTQIPSYCDPALDSTGRFYLPNLALFRLAYVLGDIMDDAVSFRAVPYSAVLDKDAQLVKWLEDLPPELELDEYGVARSLASPTTAVRRLGVQSVIIRTAFHHIRFTLHRPYAKMPASLETAVSSASQLITLVGQTRPDFLSNTALAVPGHMNWGPFHVFSAAMFFSFHLISQPDQPAASLFRENIRRSMASLAQSRWMPVADKALTILQALAPLYEDARLEDPPAVRERKKAQVLSLVKTLAFPYQGSRRAEGATASSAGSTPSLPNAQPDAQPQTPVSSMRWTPSHVELARMAQYAAPLPPQQSQMQYRIAGGSEAAQGYTYPQAAYEPQVQHHQQHEHAPMMGDMQPTMYAHPADESAMWGASVGFGLGEWEQFLSVMQRPSGIPRGEGMVQNL